MSLVATRLQNWRVQNPELDRNMTRPCEYGALDFFIEQTNAPSSIINPNLRDKAFASIGNTVQVPVINYDENVQVSNVRSCVIADNENTSALVTLVWATYSIGGVHEQRNFIRTRLFAQNGKDVPCIGKHFGRRGGCRNGGEQNASV